MNKIKSTKNKRPIWLKISHPPLWLDDMGHVTVIFSAAQNQIKKCEVKSSIKLLYCMRCVLKKIIFQLFKLSVFFDSIE